MTRQTGHCVRSYITISRDTGLALLTAVEHDACEKIQVGQGNLLLRDLDETRAAAGNETTLHLCLVLFSHRTRNRRNNIAYCRSRHETNVSDARGHQASGCERVNPELEVLRRFLRVITWAAFHLDRRAGHGRTSKRVGERTQQKLTPLSLLSGCIGCSCCQSQYVTKAPDSQFSFFH